MGHTTGYNAGPRFHPWLLSFIHKVLPGQRGIPPTAVWSSPNGRASAAIFRKKYLKDILCLGSDFKWKLNQGVKRLQQLTRWLVFVVFRVEINLLWAKALLIWNGLGWCVKVATGPVRFTKKWRDGSTGLCDVTKTGKEAAEIQQKHKFFTTIPPRMIKSYTSRAFMCPLKQLSIQLSYI